MLQPGLFDRPRMSQPDRMASSSIPTRHPQCVKWPPACRHLQVQLDNSRHRHHKNYGPTRRCLVQFEVQALRQGDAGCRGENRRCSIAISVVPPRQLLQSTHGQMTASDSVVKPLICRLASQLVQYFFTSVQTSVIGLTAIRWFSTATACRRVSLCQQHGQNRPAAKCGAQLRMVAVNTVPLKRLLGRLATFTFPHLARPAHASKDTIGLYRCDDEAPETQRKSWRLTPRYRRPSVLWGPAHVTVEDPKLGLPSEASKRNTSTSAQGSNIPQIETLLNMA